MNEQKLREMMKIYTVSKQVNKKAEKNFIKFSSQYYKLHKNDMTPDLLSEVNSLRTIIKSDRVAFSTQNSPQVSPRLTSNHMFNFKEEKPTLNSIYSDDKHQDIYNLYVDEINDLKQCQCIIYIQNSIKPIPQQNNKKVITIKRSKLEQERARVNDLTQQSNQLQKSSVSMLNCSLDQRKQTLNSELNKEQSRELFKSEICRALEKYNNSKQDQSNK
ncbi:unnamed protein product (macronuclear) [Paramecium tetraurelia]|uniref:Uncharacterized protein n=1 Tax=Paramecium tetraurelia TaxID=5888 RepID=A0C225_PARTE|nr:uncharacterized protein GSPATT00034319001 [Paramecium tetraurelia]CAK64842.1 unnamed protein product [Paramecium tetraurelia]|eukprot:XP_001432239.1 hypothetical protein (macronuclear) [Paramecium tetraurelia strain d4-2]